jgi:hypothetical protein
MTFRGRGNCPLSKTEPRTTKREKTMNAPFPADLADALRTHLSPDGVTALIALLQPASNYRPANDRGRAAIREAVWFAAGLTDLIGVQTFNETVDEIGL